MEKSWGPRWNATDSASASGLRQLVKTPGTAEQKGGTWPYLGDENTLHRVFSQTGVKDNAGTPPPWPGKLGSVLDQLRAHVRQQSRARIAARVAQIRAGKTLVTAEAREVELDDITPGAIRAYRERIGFSQRAMADAVGISRGLVAECERGKRPGFRIRRWVAEQLRAEGQARGT